MLLDSFTEFHLLFTSLHKTYLTHWRKEFEGPIRDYTLSTVVTALLCGCSVVKLNFFVIKLNFFGQYELTHLSWLSSPRPGYRPVVTTVQMTAGLNRIMDTRRVREYPDSSISKGLTVLKWRMITTLTAGKVEGTELGTLGNTLSGWVWMWTHVVCINPSSPRSLVSLARLSCGASESLASETTQLSLHSRVVVLSLNLTSIFTKSHLGFGQYGLRGHLQTAFKKVVAIATG